MSKLSYRALFAAFTAFAILMIAASFDRYIDGVSGLPRVLVITASGAAIIVIAWWLFLHNPPVRLSGDEGEEVQA